ncbi:MAG: hypothetical protein JOY72_06370 [Actinobacteria bacterium]|nr:hypothetical protein [Actinomycetota bacterium]MBV8479914.1 hypothetical protein [Actinomycetota bacterium]
MQRRALGVLFTVLMAAFLIVAVAATGHGTRGWIVAVAAAAIAVWFGSLALWGFRR